MAWLVFFATNFPTTFCRNGESNSRPQSCISLRDLLRTLYRLSYMAAATFNLGKCQFNFSFGALEPSLSALSLFSLRRHIFVFQTWWWDNLSCFSQWPPPPHPMGKKRLLTQDKDFLSCHCCFCSLEPKMRVKMILRLSLFIFKWLLFFFLTSWDRIVWRINVVKYLDSLEDFVFDSPLYH